MFPKSREPAASMSDPQTGRQTPPPSLPPVTQETLDPGKEQVAPRLQGELGGRVGRVLSRGGSHRELGVGSPALTSDASADAGTWTPELLESHRAPRGALTKPHQLLHQASEGAHGEMDPW